MFAMMNKYHVVDLWLFCVNVKTLSLFPRLTIENELKIEIKIELEIDIY
jgi:hypothetical protein